MGEVYSKKGYKRLKLLADDLPKDLWAQAKVLVHGVVPKGLDGPPRQVRVGLQKLLGETGHRFAHDHKLVGHGSEGLGVLCKTLLVQALNKGLDIGDGRQHVP
jgi:hypothetical protein